jgi:hypothetical protein
MHVIATVCMIVCDIAYRVSLLPLQCDITCKICVVRLVLEENAPNSILSELLLGWVTGWSLKGGVSKCQREEGPPAPLYINKLSNQSSSMYVGFHMRKEAQCAQVNLGTWGSVSPATTLASLKRV